MVMKSANSKGDIMASLSHMWYVIFDYFERSWLLSTSTVPSNLHGRRLHGHPLGRRAEPISPGALWREVDLVITTTRETPSAWAPLVLGILMRNSSFVYPGRLFDQICLTLRWNILVTSGNPPPFTGGIDIFTHHKLSMLLNTLPITP